MTAPQALGAAQNNCIPTRPAREAGRMRSLPTRLAAGLALLALVSALSLTACRSTLPNRAPLGEAFPSVRGEGLDGTAWRLPEDLAGAPALLLVGYVQKAQFDADRWLLGLLQAEAPLRVLEVPTIRGWVPRLMAGTIDQGMRDGIPEEDWASVVTVYDGAARIQRFTGTETPQNMRVLLLDEQGRVRWFHDRGYSARVLSEMLAAVR